MKTGKEQSMQESQLKVIAPCHDPDYSILTMRREKMTNKLIKIAVCIIILIAPSLAFSAPASEARIAELERTILNLQQRIAALEAQPVQDDEGARTTSVKPGNSGDIKNWRQLRLGMKEQDVERLLGSPRKVIATEVFFVWYYSGGNVNFNAESGKVDGWSEP
ncbi:outer membrane protein assembly factor BamE [Chlorobium sp. BLA1]|uniref:outer membrane protein assembly factor BamE n=1 Tax=Candidatus Chlorobium masyuteum TaxID=2716876 RepID=UPI001422F408|nr:outer membrane protein assembly factor BamE [Candidatus Chlorobium masyuteum]NHQ59837.1 outer membrane protein assembly factor BamE [Candidatus Chlorobium masyuteum]